MFDISSTRRLGRKLVDESLSENPDLKKERTYLNKISDHVLNFILKLQKIETADIYPLKNFCNGLNKCLLFLKDLKDPVFGEVVTAVNNVTVISLLMTEDVAKAQSEFGKSGDIKDDLITTLGLLSRKLKETSIALREREAVRV